MPDAPDAVAAYLAQRYADAARIVEVGVGQRCDTARHLARVLPNTVILATDVDPRVVRAHAACRRILASYDNAFAPRRDLYEGAALLYSIRPPPELVPAIAALGHRFRADVAIAPLSEDADACRADGWVRPDPSLLLFLRRPPARPPRPSPLPTLRVPAPGPLPQQKRA